MPPGLVVHLSAWFLNLCSTDTKCRFFLKQRDQPRGQLHLSAHTSALCLPVSTWLNSTGSTRIFLPDPGLLDNCHCCPGVCDRYGYYGSHQMKLSQFLFSWRIKSVLCWRLVMVRRPQKVEILLSSRCTSRPVGSTSQTPPLSPG